MSTVGLEGRFELGHVVSRIGGVLARHWMIIGLLALLLSGVPTALLSIAQLYYAAPSTGSPTELVRSLFSPFHIALTLGAAIVTIVCRAVLQGAVMRAAINDLTGEPVGFADSLAAGLRFLAPLIGIGILTALGTFAGFLLLIVPGVILALAWSVAAPAAVAERRGVIASLSRSLDLTRNHRFAIFGLAVILFVIQLAMSIILGLATRAFTGPTTVLAAFQAGSPAMVPIMIAQGLRVLIQTTLADSLSAAGVASIYVELRQAKEGLGADQLAAAFD